MFQEGGTHQKPFPPEHIVDLEEAAMGWVLRLCIRSILGTHTIVHNGIPYGCTLICSVFTEACILEITASERLINSS